MIVILIALLISTLMPEDSKKGVFEKSVLFKQANASIEPLKEAIPQSWIEAFKEQSERIGLKKKVEPEQIDSEKAEETAQKTNVIQEEKTANEDVKTPKDTSNETDSKTKENAEPQSKVQSLKETLNAISDNQEVLKKGSEVLFNQLAQPKTSEGGEGENALDDIVSDLDKLLDVLDNRVVETETQPNASENAR